MTTRPAVTTEAVRLDILARDLLGSAENGHVEALLDANQGLAAAAPYPPEGTSLDVPVIEAAPEVLPSVNPWE